MHITLPVFPFLLIPALFARPALTASPSSSIPTRSLTLGVPKNRLELYQPIAGSNPPQWRCLNGKGDLIPFSAINDDYCDCDDGSDEPGTSACKGGWFHCVNEGHLPKDIPNLRVNDGLCDADCCDGSDEPAGVCPNRCAALGAAYREAMEQDLKLRKKGAKIRASYIAFAKKERKRLEDALVTGRNAIEDKTREEERLKAIADHAESLSAEALAHKQKSPLYASLQSHSAALSALTQRVAHLESKLDTLTSILKDLEENHNPNYQDMAVRGAIKGLHDFLGDQAQAAEEQAAAEAEDADTVPEDDGPEEEEWTPEKLKKLAQVDLTGLLLEHEQHVTGYPAGGAEGSILWAIDHYLPEAWVPMYESARAYLAEWLIKLGVVRGVLSPADSTQTSRARSAHNDAVKALREAEAAVKKDEDALAKLDGYYGPEAEWRKLDGTCIEKNTGEYTYSVCFFGQATQKPNSGGGSHNLGSFSRWNTAAEPGTLDYYSQQTYDRGMKCWNGPDRSVQLVLTCGTENALLSVAEPEKCEYRFEGTSPALCWPLETDGHAKGEL